MTPNLGPQGEGNAIQPGGDLGPLGPDPKSSYVEPVAEPGPDVLLGPLLENNPNRVCCGGDLHSKLDEIDHNIDDLEQAMRVLPHVEDDGGSDCPFAGELYAKKEECQEKVESGVERMQGYDADLDGEIQRLKANLHQIQDDAEGLNLPEVKERYAEAEGDLQKRCRNLASDRDAISVVMARAAGVLAVSQKRKYPGGVPHGLSRGAAAPPEGPQSPEPQPGPQPPGKDLGGLLELGPLGPAPGQK